MRIPYNFEPRKYQLPLLQAMDGGIKRAFCLWHRRAGKDKCLWNYIIKEAVVKKGVYYYLFPTYSQAKKVIWNGIDNDGFSFMDHIPKSLIKSKDGTELKIELSNGSILQLIGTDKYDSIRGTNPVGCVFSEYAFHNPMAWEVIKPILKINGGWAIFNTTPNGKNHAYDMDKMARGNDKWFIEKLTISETAVVKPEIIQEERDEGMSEEMIQQEYFCSFDIGAVGSYYGNEMKNAYEQKRIGQVPFYPDTPIDIFFDLGISDMMSMWFKQDSGQAINLINYYEDNNKNLTYYYRFIREYVERIKGKIGIIYIPHDANKREFTTGKTIFQDFVREFGEGRVRLIPLTGIAMGIQAVRKVLPRCYFDKDTCKQGVRCLEGYHRKYDQIRKVFLDHPDHDWASHGADAFRYMSITISDVIEEEKKKDPFDGLFGDNYSSSNNSFGL